MHNLGKRMVSNRKGAFVVVKKGDRILLVQYLDYAPLYPSRWSLPGGYVEEGKAVRSGAERVVYMINGAIAAEKKLGRYPANLQAATDREEQLRQWLSGLGF